LPPTGGEYRSRVRRVRVLFLRYICQGWGRRKNKEVDPPVKPEDDKKEKAEKYCHSTA